MIIVAIVGAIPATIAAIGAWRATIRNTRELKTENGTTTGQYTEQTYELLMHVSEGQRDISKQLENHITNERLHAQGAKI